ncbi:D-alanyl-D-alanine carboxypeptidase/D-alanyl-D-alanine-endopeptidase [Actinophytocola xanthii]|uniref:D-alanyl-D-alanine carboxypeptidase/D-alanyl-D-alanine-endopeptidase n=1 Tax=Actinophytocola xanthii TaxID=1912961 RepID=A0A1Q8C914_9PSEU|nr:D-alanyl-D-alanine carboxypeptidase/D-alanyl-D-alanine-endopeptidase [Actinophytocola xanthii]
MLGLIGAAPAVAAGLLPAGATARASTRDDVLAARIAEITTRPEFAESSWGMRFQVLGGAEPVHAVNPEQRFVAASTVKVFIGGSAFAALGAGHRFRTTVHRTGPVIRGVLRGHLVLVAGGDLLLGPRTRPDGSLALPYPDHSYGNATEPVPGDPLRQLRHLARQTARRGIRRVEGRVVVDASLFRQGTEEIANGFTPIPVSPIMLNDNIVDVVVTPGARPGDPAVSRVSPETAYVRVVNEVVTVTTPTRSPAFGPPTPGPDGTHTVRLSGEVAVGATPVLLPYYVPDPVRFAEVAFAKTLHEEGIEVANRSSTSDVAHRVRVAEHVSPPLADQVKVMLKLSSNVHTVYFPYLVGAIAGADPVTAEATGERYQRALIEQAGLDPDDPANGGHTPDFFVGFLSHLARQPYFTAYREALPILGRDGTLADVVPDSPAAGRVFAKTGTGVSRTRVHKAMTGYLVLPDGTLVVFAEFMNQPVTSHTEAMLVQQRAGTAQGEIVTAVYETLAG